MPGKEAVKDFFRSVGDFTINSVVAGAGGAAAGIPGEFSSGVLQSDLVLLEEFERTIKNSPVLLESHGQLLPGIEEDIMALQGQAEALGFDYRAAAIAAISIMALRASAAPLLVQSAEKYRTAGNEKAAKRLLALDKFWLATQTFLLAHSANFLLKGGLVSETESSLALVGGVIFSLGLVHGVGARALKRRRNRKELI